MATPVVAAAGTTLSPPSLELQVEWLELLNALQKLPLSMLLNHEICQRRLVTKKSALPVYRFLNSVVRYMKQPSRNAAIKIAHRFMPSGSDALDFATATEQDVAIVNACWETIVKLNDAMPEENDDQIRSLFDDVVGVVWRHMHSVQIPHLFRIKSNNNNNNNNNDDDDGENDDENDTDGNNDYDVVTLLCHEVAYNVGMDVDAMPLIHYNSFYQSGLRNEAIKCYAMVMNGAGSSLSSPSAATGASQQPPPQQQQQQIIPEDEHQSPPPPPPQQQQQKSAVIRVLRESRAKDIGIVLERHNAKRVLPLEIALNNPVALCTLREYMARNLCEENLMFRFAVLEYKRDEVSPQQRVRMAQRIWNEFLDDECATAQITVSSSQRIERGQLASARADLFDTLQDACVDTIRSDVYPRFLGSKQYRQMLRLVEHVVAVHRHAVGVEVRATNQTPEK